MSAVDLPAWNCTIVSDRILIGPTARKGISQCLWKRHTVDRIVAKLRKADVELGKGKKVPEVCKLLEVVTRSGYSKSPNRPIVAGGLLSLAAEVGWHEARDGQTT